MLLGDSPVYMCKSENPEVKFRIINRWVWYNFSEWFLLHKVFSRSVMLNLEDYVTKICLSFLCSWKNSGSFDSYSFGVLMIYCYSWLSIIFLLEIAESLCLARGYLSINSFEIIDSSQLHKSLLVKNSF